MNRRARRALAGRARSAAKASDAQRQALRTQLEAVMVDSERRTTELRTGFSEGRRLRDRTATPEQALAMAEGLQLAVRTELERQ